MAAGARGQPAVLVAVQIDVFAHAGQISVFGGLQLHFLLLEEFAQGHHFVGGELGHHVSHGRAFAFAALEVFQLFGDVLPVLARQARENLARRFTFHAVTYKAHATHDLFGARLIGLCQDARGKSHTRQQASGLCDKTDSFHGHFRTEITKKTPLVLRQRRFRHTRFMPVCRPRCCEPRPGRSGLQARWQQTTHHLTRPR